MHGCRTAPPLSQLPFEKQRSFMSCAGHVHCSLLCHLWPCKGKELMEVRMLSQSYHKNAMSLCFSEWAELTQLAGEDPNSSLYMMA